MKENWTDQENIFSSLLLYKFTSDLIDIIQMSKQ